MNFSEWKQDFFNPNSKYLTLRVLIIAWKVIVISVSFLNIACNSILFFDMYLTLKNPFYPRKKRVLYYYIFLTVVLLASLTNIIYSIYSN